MEKGYDKFSFVLRFQISHAVVKKWPFESMGILKRAIIYLIMGGSVIIRKIKIHILQI